MTTGFDMTDSIVPRSDQLNAEDMLAGPRTVTILDVHKGSAEQPVEIVLAEFGDARPFKPSKTVRRILVAAWGTDASAYVGKRLTIYRDPTVRFGGQDVGGIRVSHMSGIDKPLTLALTVTRGKRAPYVVKPLADDAPAKAPDVSWPDKIALATSRDDLATIRDQARTAGANGREIDKLLTDRARELGIAKAAAETTSDEPA